MGQRQLIQLAGIRSQRGRLVLLAVGIVLRIGGARRGLILDEGLVCRRVAYVRIDDIFCCRRCILAHVVSLDCEGVNGQRSNTKQECQHKRCYPLA